MASVLSDELGGEVLFEEPLAKSSPSKFGTWGGLAVIAIGKRGGKIVGYTSNGKPIYAGSTEAKKLSEQRAQKETTAEAVLAWLSELGIKTKFKGSGIYMSDASAKLLASAFEVPYVDMSPGISRISLGKLQQHIGKPLTPKGDAQTAHFQAKAASGELDDDPFPELSKLKYSKNLKSGQHQVDLYIDDKGKKWVFKTDDEKISRAEEAAVRLSRLILGPERAAAAKHVTVGGKPGVLIEWLKGSVFNDASHSNPPQTVLDKHLPEIIQHQVVDWIVSNHDSHAGNFLVTPNGKVGGFDKGQAWKFFGKDKLSTGYKPNASAQIYVPFWKRWHKGEFSEKWNGKDIIEAAGAALDEAEKISKEQFESIVAPYVAVRAKKDGLNEASFTAKMWKRLQGAREDFQKFLSEQLGYQVVIPSKSKDNFETMPETESESGKKKGGSKLTKDALLEFLKQYPTEKILAAELAHAFDVSSQKANKFLQGLYKNGILDRKKTKSGYAYFSVSQSAAPVSEPDKPAVIAEKTTQPVSTDAVAGWPITKGKTTVHHPGNPVEPGMDWWKGYPGPGFLVKLTYKGKDYSVEFLDADGSLDKGVKVQYPDGTVANFSSPNAASDSLVLFDKGLSLELTGTDKKKLGISYPAKTAFGITKFKNELLEAKTVPENELKASTEVPPKDAGDWFYDEFLGGAEKPETWDKGDFQALTADLSSSTYGDLVTWEDTSGERWYSVLDAASNRWLTQKGPELNADKWETITAPELYSKLEDEAKPSTVHLYTSEEVGLAKKQGTLPKKVIPLGYKLKTGPGYPIDLSDPKAFVSLLAAPPGTKVHFGYLGGGWKPTKYTVTKTEDNVWQFEGKDGFGETVEDIVELHNPEVLDSTVEYPVAPPKPASKGVEVKQPLTPGVPHTVKKKFPSGKHDVSLTLSKSGVFSVGIMTPDGVESGDFKSLSSASDWVWLKQKGYNSKKEYKEETGKNKVASGGGWKFWGIDPSKYVVSEDNFETMPDTPSGGVGGEWGTLKLDGLGETFVDLPKMTQLSFPLTSATNYYYRRGPFSWEVWSEGEWHDIDAMTVLNAVESALKNGTTVHTFKPNNEDLPETVGELAHFPPTAPTTTPVEKLAVEDPTIKPNAKNLEEWPILEELPLTKEMIPKAEVGAQVKAYSPTLQPKEAIWTKQPNGEWLADSGAVATDSDFEDWLGDKGHQSLYQFNALPFAAGPKWEPLFPGGITQKGIDALPIGTKVSYKFDGKYDVFEKQSDGAWKHQGTGLSVKTALLVTELNKPETTELKTQAPSPKEKWSPFDPNVWNIDLSLLDTFSPGSKLKYTNNENGVEVEVVKTPTGWAFVQGSVAVATDVLENILTKQNVSNIQVQAPNGVPQPQASVETQPKKIPMPKTLFGGAKVVTANSTDIPEVVKNKINFIQGQMEDWTEEGEKKSSNWPAWVPPPGTFIEGQLGEEKFWLTTTVSGHSVDGEAAPTFQLGMINEDGKSVTSTKAYKSGTFAIKDLIPKMDWSIQPKEFLEAIGQPVFGAGESFTSVEVALKNPDGKTVAYEPTVHPVDMTPEEQAQPVKTSLPFAKFIKAKVPDAEVKMDKSDLGKMIVSVPPMLSDGSKTGFQALEGILKDTGLEFPIETSHAAAWVKVPSSLVSQEYLLETTAQVAASTPPIVSEDNWETMPEDAPKILESWFPPATIKGFLDKYPEGTQFKLGTAVFTKVVESGVPFFKSSFSTLQAHNFASNISASGYNCVVAPPITAIPEAPKPVAKPKPKPPKKTKAQKAKEKIAKATAEWVETLPSVTDPELRLALAHFRKAMTTNNWGGDIWARMEGDDVVLGSGHPEFYDFLDKIGLSDGKSVNGPIPTASFFTFSKAQLQKAFPGATMIDGPDGKKYPYGTKFQTKTIETTVESLVQDQITKYSAHKTDPDNKTVLKISGGGDEQKEKLQKILEDFGIDTDEQIKVGSSYTLVGVPKTELSKVGKTETQVVPNIPEQPPAFVPAPLPLIGANLKNGDPATVNRMDLGLLDSIKIPKGGHWIRCGKFGVFDGGQIRVTKVRTPGGKEYYEVTGQPQHVNEVSPKLGTGTATFFRAKSKPGAPAVDYNEEDGVTSLTGGFGHQTNGWRGETQAGSSIVMTKGKGGMNKFFKVRIPVEKNVETELMDAFGKLGFDADAAIAEPTDEDNRKLIKYQVLKSMMGAQAWGPMESMTEAELDKKLADYKAKTKAQKASIEIGGNGKHVVVTNDDDVDAARLEGLRFVYGCRSSVSSAVTRILEDDLGSNRTKIAIGSKTNNAGSFGSDEAVGGLNAVFLRFGNEHGTGWGNINSGTANPKLLFHPRILRRTDWWAWSGDAFGATGTKSHHGHSSGNRMNAMRYKKSTNEVNFEDMVSMQDLAGVLVHSADQKKEFVKLMKDAGKDEINSIKVEDFVVVHSPGQSKGTIADSVVGLKDGVLP